MADFRPSNFHEADLKENCLSADQQYVFLREKFNFADEESKDNNGYRTGSHLLFVKAGVAYPQQVENIFKRLLKKCSEIEPKINQNFQISTKKKFDPTGKKSILELITGTHYVWINDSRAYNMIIGLNQDGSRRIIESFDDDEEMNFDNPPIDIFSDSIKKSTSWGDQIKITTLEPLINLDEFTKFELREEQKAILRIRTNFFGRIKIVPYKAHDYLETEIPGSLTATRVNSQLTNVTIRQEILNSFKGLSSSNKSIYTKVGDQFKESVYPIVEDLRSKEDIQKDGKKNIVIKFDPETYDAKFALPMLRAFKIKFQGRENILLFNQSLTKEGKDERAKEKQQKV